MRITLITLFPDMFVGPFGTSMLKKAQDKGLVSIDFVNLRDFGIGPRRQVDDTPYGGGDGMVLRADVVVPAIESVRTKNSHIVLLTPQGKAFKQADATRLSQHQHVILVCGHYEGFDERIREFVDEQVSIGDYILTGGEIPAMVLVDAIARLVPGVLGGGSSADVESFSDGKTLEYPQYTRPEEFRGAEVPSVLRSGNHAEIEQWQREQASAKTTARYTK